MQQQTHGWERATPVAHHAHERHWNGALPAKKTVYRRFLTVFHARALKQINDLAVATVFRRFGNRKNHPA
jgi:hypothetical protein